MKQRKIIRWGITFSIIGTFSVASLIICFFIAGGVGYIQFLQGLETIDELRLLNLSPEAVFQSRFMERHSIPPEASEIYAVEGC